MRKRELTPSRNHDVQIGQLIGDGDRYIGIRTEEQLAISQHLIRTEEVSPFRVGLVYIEEIY
jgi:hypothetical protein